MVWIVKKGDEKEETRTSINIIYMIIGGFSSFICDLLTKKNKIYKFTSFDALTTETVNTAL